MEQEYMEININPIHLDSLSAFTNTNQGLHTNRNDVYFLRYIGFEEEKTYISSIQNMDAQMLQRKRLHQIGYLRVAGLHNQIDSRDVTRYTEAYVLWEKAKELTRPVAVQFHFKDDIWQNTLFAAFKRTMEQYVIAVKHASPTMQKNFAVKLMHWIDCYLPQLFIEAERKEGNPKFVFYGDIKAQEYLFLYLLVLVGCDVLYLNPQKDCSVDSSLLALSSLCKKTHQGELAIAPLSAKELLSCRHEGEQIKQEGTTRIVMDSSLFRRRPARHAAGGVREADVRQENPMKREELEYIELAKKASSVVMIEVYDENHKCFKTGSGVIISEKGYIITNFHVACEGVSYGIRLEEEEKLYETEDLIKYNQVYDLAVLRIERRCQPIRLYQKKEHLVRGQKVVAIGSPLGLFNSVSDGIISGFRQLDHVSMIQFTAPTSHGSSGGALLNLYGELVGIITGGFDDAQNINLAVDYLTISNFAKGFLGSC